MEERARVDGASVFYFLLILNNLKYYLTLPYLTLPVQLTTPKKG